MSLDDVRAWLRLGTAADDAVIERSINAATNICEAFIGGRLIVRAAEEILPIGAGVVRLRVSPVVAVDGVTLLAGDSETVLEDGDYRVTIAPDGRGRLTIGALGDVKRVRVAYRAGMAGDAGAVPEAIRHGIIRMAQHLYIARDGAGIAPPAAIATLWQPWRRLTLGGELMISADVAVRARALEMLAADGELMAVVHGIFDGMPPRSSAPYVTVGVAEGIDWGTKDRAGRELRLMLTLVGVGSAVDDRAAGRIEAVVTRLHGAAGDWSIVAARTIRTRFSFARDSGWRHEIIVRCRCLAA